MVYIGVNKTTALIEIIAFMKLLLRILRYLAPSKGKIVLVVFVSMVTSLFSVVSIYSILPLLNEVFSTVPTAQSSAPSASPAKPGTPVAPEKTAQPSLPAKSTPESPATAKNQRLKDTERLKNWALEKFQQIFSAPTRELTLLKICLFLISAFAIKNLFVYINQQ
ncbi:MAG: hypothetical protein HGB26_09055, partial [Desulfobulbaceae bacterium]|nr:hypothetical protein [Desulfobulbaceae bacterium]